MSKLEVYLVWQNDGLLGIYRRGDSALSRLKRVLEENSGGNWVRGGIGDEKDPYVQRWWQREGRIARLSVEKEIVQ